MPSFIHNHDLGIRNTYAILSLATAYFFLGSLATLLEELAIVTSVLIYSGVLKDRQICRRTRRLLHFNFFFFQNSLPLSNRLHYIDFRESESAIYIRLLLYLGPEDQTPVYISESQTIGCYVYIYEN